MQITTKLPKRLRSRAAPRVARAGLPSPAEQARTQHPARRGGGPEDRAFYSCMCGYAFNAAVTTSVDCPHCGTQQAW